jgi:hypothetical protein
VKYEKCITSIIFRICVEKMFHEAGWEKTPRKCVKVGETLSKYLAILYKSGRKALFLLESQKE